MFLYKGKHSKAVQSSLLIHTSFYCTWRNQPNCTLSYLLSGPVPNPQIHIYSHAFLSRKWKNVQTLPSPTNHLFGQGNGYVKISMCLQISGLGSLYHVSAVSISSPQWRPPTFMWVTVPPSVFHTPGPNDQKECAPSNVKGKGILSLLKHNRHRNNIK